jgi:phospholipid/cholesterol/gamma-HCH transport system substrate-binding protein
MATRKIDNVKVGLFVAISLVLLIFALYKVSKSSSFFSENFTLKAQFKNVSGLMIGNNIRYAGIQVGTIEKIDLINDSLVQVTMLIDEKMKNFIHKQDFVSIGTDGLVGNKLLNISAGTDRINLVVDKDILLAKEGLNTDEMMLVLNKTNTNISVISEELKSTVLRLNNSTALWNVLNEKTIPDNLIASMSNVRNATVKADEMVLELQTIIKNIKNGKGSLGVLLTDTAIAVNLNQAVDKIKRVGDNAQILTQELNEIAQNVKLDLTASKGAYNAILKDTLLTAKLNSSLYNIEAGTVSFNQNMEALKHNFLFRGYFKKQEKKKKKSQELLDKITIGAK